MTDIDKTINLELSMSDIASFAIMIDPLKRNLAHIKRMYGRFEMQSDTDEDPDLALMQNSEGSIYYFNDPLHRLLFDKALVANGFTAYELWDLWIERNNERHAWCVLTNYQYGEH